METVFRAVPPTELAANQGKRKKSCVGCRYLGSRAHVSLGHPSPWGRQGGRGMFCELRDVAVGLWGEEGSLLCVLCGGFKRLGLGRENCDCRVS